MRNLLLLLLLANVLYFLWGQVSGDSSERGVAIVTERELGPPLELADGSSTPVPDSALPEDGIESDVPVEVIEPIELAAAVGRTCVSIGPFRDSGDADRALADTEADGMLASLRTTRGEIFVGHWVQIRNIADRATADRMLETLQAGGIGEAYMVRTDDEGIKISLGLFGDMSGAERTELQAKSMDLPAEITPRTREGTVFYVDIALPPGRGAGSLIEEYGEEQVLLRGAASCPRAR